MNVFVALAMFGAIFLIVAVLVGSLQREPPRPPSVKDIAEEMTRAR